MTIGKGKQRMREYYEVQSAFYDDGRVIANIMNVVKGNRKPKPRNAVLKRCDVYYDYFSRYEDAMKFVEDARRA